MIVSLVLTLASLLLGSGREINIQLPGSGLTKKIKIKKIIEPMFGPYNLHSLEKGTKFQVTATVDHLRGQVDGACGGHTLGDREASGSRIVHGNIN